MEGRCASIPHRKEHREQKGAGGLTSLWRFEESTEKKKDCRRGGRLPIPEINLKDRKGEPYGSVKKTMRNSRMLKKSGVTGKVEKQSSIVNINGERGLSSMEGKKAIYFTIA